MPAPDPARDWKLASALAVFTILANLVEGTVSITLGLRDETLALFGFGVDSFIEVISALGIAHLVWRLRRAGGGAAERTRFERTALRVTGTAFYLLVAGLVAGTVVSLAGGRTPESTTWGIVISLVSIAVMLFLVAAKRRVGRRLASAPILADANCTLACVWMSVALLVSSLTFALTGFAWLDAFGALAIAWFAFGEGREAFAKARGETCHACC